MNSIRYLLNRKRLSALGAAFLLLLLGPALAWAEGSQSVTNPLNQASFCGLIKAVLNVALTIGVPIAVLAIVYAGFKFVAARGNSEALQSAQKNFFYTFIGIAIFFGAAVIAGIVVATVQQFGVSVGSC